MKRITGIRIRTNNKKSHEIMQLWNTFYSQGHVEKLGLIGKEIYGVYFNYSSNEHGDFDLLIGGESEMSEGYPSVEIADTQYKQYITLGEMPQKIVDTWKNIWNNPIGRAYKTDYELYTFEDDIKNPRVDIFIGVS